MSRVQSHITPIKFQYTFIRMLLPKTILAQYDLFWSKNPMSIWLLQITDRNLEEVFWYFQGVQKKNSDIKLVNNLVMYLTT